MLVPGIEKHFRGHLACKLMTRPTALFHSMRSKSEDDSGTWNAGRNILCFFINRFSHMHCLGIEPESQQYGTTKYESGIYSTDYLFRFTSVVMLQYGKNF